MTRQEFCGHINRVINQQQRAAHIARGGHRWFDKVFVTEADLDDVTWEEIAGIATLLVDPELSGTPAKKPRGKKRADV